MKKNLNFLACLVFLAATMLMSFSVYAQTGGEAFQQAVAEYQKSPSVDGADKLIKLAVAMNKLPPVPEEARKHFIKGAALFKDAKSPVDFTQVLDEFKQATRLAPWWPEARYNFALACESAGEYASAIANLKLYQLFKLSDTEARAVQDKIYVLEAKQEKSAKETSPEVVAQKKQNNDAELIKSLDGARYAYQLNIRGDLIVDHALDIRGTTLIHSTCLKYHSPNTVVENPVGVWIEHSRMQIVGRQATFSRDGMLMDTFTISEDGKSITGQPNGGEARIYYREK